MPIPPRHAQKAGPKFLSEVLAENARRERRASELSQDEVAERMTALGHAWSRQTTSDVERNVRNVTVDELLGLALVLGTSIGHLLEPGGVRSDFRTTIDPGNTELPYIAPQNADDAYPTEIPGTAGIGITPRALGALITSRIILRLEWDDKPTGINVMPWLDDLDDFMSIVNDFRRRGSKREGQNEGNDSEARRDVDLPVRRLAERAPEDG